MNNTYNDWLNLLKYARSGIWNKVMRELGQAGINIPDYIDVDIIDSQGHVISRADMLWVKQRVVYIDYYSHGYNSALEQYGFREFSIGDGSYPPPLEYFKIPVDTSSTNGDLEFTYEGIKVASLPKN